MSKKEKKKRGPTSDYLLVPAPAASGCLMTILTLGLLRGRR